MVHYLFNNYIRKSISMEPNFTGSLIQIQDIAVGNHSSYSDYVWYYECYSSDIIIIHLILTIIIIIIFI